ncbi:MAG: TetR/AcrR family transcriptional regulator [Actinomycetota bacterium]
MSRRPRRTIEQHRDHLVAVAEQLFYDRGLHAVGVDQVAAAADVAPTTLYRAFASKDELVTAYVERRDEAWRRWWRDAVEPHADPAAALCAVFAAAAEQVAAHGYRGCPFLMGLAEYPDPAHPAHRAAVANKRWARRELGSLCAGAVDDAAAADRLADQLMVVLDGVYASAQDLGPGGPAAGAAELAGSLISAAQLAGATRS